MIQRNENNMLKQALIYCKSGLSIIPIRAGTKKPAIRSWKPYQQTRANERQVNNWFSNGDKGIAVIVGEVSNGLACRDFDTMGEYKLWVAGYPQLAKMLPTVQTANGMHVYFEGYCSGIKHISNGELRGSGGYCLMPPSIHPSGAEYQWVNPILNGNLLAIDPVLAGFLSETGNVTEQTEQPEQTEQTEAMVEGGIENAIRETLPKMLGTRNRKIFDFARALKSLPLYAFVKPQDLKGLVKQWHTRALPKIRTKEFEETWIDFLKAWPRIKYKKGNEPIMAIFENAIRLEPPEIALVKYPDNKPLQLLTSFCKELQKASGNSPFFLSVRTAGNLMNISHMQASRWLFLLVSDGILREIEKGGTAETVRRATRFRYIADC